MAESNPKNGPAENRQAAESAQGMWTKEFILLMSVCFLVYANMSVFFKYYGYLQSLPINPGRFGLLMGIFSAVSLALRPVFSPLFNESNSRPLLYLSGIMVMLSLVAYSIAGGFWSMLVVRCLHGVSFVIMGTALMPLLVTHIPSDRSAQAFGIMSIVIMLPNTVVPPLWPFLENIFGGFTNILLAFAGLTVLVFPLIMMIGSGETEKQASGPAARLTWAEIKADLTNPKIVTLLSAMLALYCGTALVFFFTAGFAEKAGLAGIGFFFTLTTIGEIGVRLAAGSRFDRMDKARLLAATMLALALGYGLVGHVPNIWPLYTLGLLLGVGWGVGMPVFNGLMFDLSEPKFKAMNTNLGLQMFQGGYFLGPIIGGIVVQHFGFVWLFYCCAALSLVGAGLCLALSKGEHI